MKAIVAALFLAALSCLTTLSVSTDGECYQYYDPSLQYNLDPVASSYPWDEINYMMSQNPQLIKTFAEGTPVQTSVVHSGPYYTPVSEVCTSQRLMLKAFQVDGKQCFVIRPEVQQVRYTRCTSDRYNRNCQYCSSSGYGAVSKCQEEYEWQNVWAYCKPTISTIPVYPGPKVAIQPQVPGGAIYVKQQSGYGPYQKSLIPHGVWKRTVPLQYGKIEVLSLYLPFQCQCKNYKC